MSTIEVRIASGADDVEERASGSMGLSSSDLELVTDGSAVQTVGLRFLGLNIPQGAVVTSAYLQFQTDEVSTGAASLTIRGQDVGDAAPFSSTAFNASSRVRTDASISWTPSAWSTVGEASLAQRTPDISAIVSEIVSRSDWAALNDIVLLITGSGRRTAEAFEGGAAKAPLLHIEYTSPGTGTGAGNVSISDVSVTEGNSGTKLATFNVSRTGTAAFSVDYATANGSAAAGTDYTAIPLTTLNFAAGETTKIVSVSIRGDTTAEGNETFFVNLSNAVGPGAVIVDGSGMGTIVDDDTAASQPTVRNVWSTTALGSPDPSGLAYVPGKGLFLCDSEVNESPFNSTTNMFLVQTNDGGVLTRLAGYKLTGFTIEPTGLAYVPSSDLLFISDDDADRMYWVDPDNPQTKLGEFRTALSGPTDAEDVAYDGFDGDAGGHDGHLYIANGVNANIREVTLNGTLVRTIALPTIIKDPEALVWDDVHNVFFVGGKFSANIWMLDRNGAILDTITLLSNFPRPGGSRAKVTDLELAPSSDPFDSPDKLSLYVADYGADQVNDGRLFEINLGDFFFA
ncbi:Calx-beta domain-containing protein [Sphingomonas sp. GCM10030256]|uniref:Calx-beta domain-containing protein n=1 Tax=Sphingomonas sp. GCM10030256 TaxID=3273427 RepID=UPI00362184D6